MSTKRKRVPIRDRLTPCQVCDHPISHRHHVLSMAKWGETEATIQLCPNCHELYHIMQDAWIEKARGKRKTGTSRLWLLLAWVMEEWGADDPRFGKLSQMAMFHLALEQRMLGELADPKIAALFKSGGVLDQLEASVNATWEKMLQRIKDELELE